MECSQRGKDADRWEGKGTWGIERSERKIEGVKKAGERVTECVWALGRVLVKMVGALLLWQPQCSPPTCSGDKEKGREGKREK